jgi:hypothetical protein
LVLEQNNYFALSWMIAELGRLKDSGLHVIAVKEALQLVSGLDEETAFKTTYSLLGRKQEKLPVLLDAAETACKTFFGEHNLESLVIGVRKNIPAKEK